jgi:hypothetical protein
MGEQPHTLATPLPPQVSGAVQAGPQISEPPQLSDTVPQLVPLGHIVRGVHPHVPAVPPPPQVSGGVQVLPGQQG